jgi:hypothetical protein
MFQGSTSKRISKLRTALAGSRSAESLRDLPERLALIIERYDSLTVNPDYRADVFTVLDAAASLAESLMEDTYPAEYAMSRITQTMAVLPRVINHLMTRPQTSGFSILNPSNGTVFPQVHTTEQEANASLDALQGMGAAKNCIVVPVKVSSMHAIQPLDRRLAAPTIPVLDPDHLPAGIRPPIIPHQQNIRPSSWDMGWEPETPRENEHHPRDFDGPRADDVAKKAFDWAREHERTAAKAAGPNLSIPIDAHSEMVSLPNSAPHAQENGRPSDPSPPADGAGGPILQPNIDGAAPPTVPPAPTSQTEKA